VTAGQQRGWSRKLTAVLAIGCAVVGTLAGTWFGGNYPGYTKPATLGDGSLKLETRLSQQAQPLVRPNR